MGMDVEGVNGNSFRANVFGWPVILHMMRTYAPAISKETYDGMTYNDGKGIESGPYAQCQCDYIADKLSEVLIKEPAELFVVANESDPTLAMGNDVLKAFGVRSQPATISRGKIIEWISFLRECDGFHVW